VELRFDSWVVVERAHANGDEPTTRPLSAEEAGAANRTKGLRGANVPAIGADQVVAAQQPELLARNESSLLTPDVHAVRFTSAHTTRHEFAPISAALMGERPSAKLLALMITRTAACFQQGNHTRQV